MNREPMERRIARRSLAPRPSLSLSQAMRVVLTKPCATERRVAARGSPRSDSAAMPPPALSSFSVAMRPSVSQIDMQDYASEHSNAIRPSAKKVMHEPDLDLGDGSAMDATSASGLNAEPDELGRLARAVGPGNRDDVGERRDDLHGGDFCAAVPAWSGDAG